MYRALPTEERLGFGDVLEAPWLFDLYLREDAKALKQEQQGQQKVLIALPEPPEGDREGRRDSVMASSDYHRFAIGHGNQRRAIILTDDCEMASLQGRDGEKARGRVMMAAVKDATSEDIDKVPALKYGLFPLPASADPIFAGGVVVLEAAFSVHMSALLNTSLPPIRVVSLDGPAQLALTRRWSAHATRHGPLVALVESNKFGKMLTANGDSDIAAELDDRVNPRPLDPSAEAVAKAILAACSASWQLEGPVLDAVADGWESRNKPEVHQPRIANSLRSMRLAADQALGLLGEEIWAPAGTSGLDHSETLERD